MKPDTFDDDTLMRRALRLAVRGQGRVEPNPMVGCVIAGGRRVLGEGWHRRFGGAHAEVEAIRAAQRSHGAAALRSATAYVTLEPCNHTGKTPPCTDALLAAGIARVVAAMRDPHPLVRGRGLARLRAAGVEVHEGLLQAEARALNAPFIKLVTRRRPWVILKWAQSLDGRIATVTGDSRWISDAVQRADAHRVRGRVDAIAVGVGTVLCDDPLLTCRDAPARRVAARIVLDPTLRTPPGCRLVRSAREAPVLIVASQDAAKQREQALGQSGCEVLRIRTHDGMLDLAALLDALGARDMTNLLVEGGGKTLGAFLDAGLHDEVNIYIAPTLIGGAGAPGASGGRGAAKVADALRWPAETLRRLGNGWVLRARTSGAADAGTRRGRSKDAIGR